MNSTPLSRESSITLFLDRTHQSKHTERLLKLLGVAVEVHRNHFVHDSPDHEWIPICAANGWVIITGDKGIELDGLNRATVIDSAAKIFIVHDHRSQGLDQTVAIVSARNKIADTARGNVGPFYCPIQMVSDAHVGKPTFYPGGHAIQPDPPDTQADAQPKLTKGATRPRRTKKERGPTLNFE